MKADRQTAWDRDGLDHPRGSRVSTSELLDEVDEYFHLGATVSPGDTVLDVGANVGAFSLRVAKACDGDVRILCFEPSPHTFQSLRTNFANNPLLRRTRHSLHPVGATSREHEGRELSFYNFRRFPTNSTFDLQSKRREFEIFFEDRGNRVKAQLDRVLPAWPGRWLGAAADRMISSLPKGRIGWWTSKQIMGLESIQAKLETLETLVHREKVSRIDLLKIDVEGHELEVLRGLGEKSWRKVRQVVLETHNRDGRQPAIEALLRENGLADIVSSRQTTIDNGLESILMLARRS